MTLSKRWAILWAILAIVSAAGFVLAANHSLDVSERVQREVPYVRGTAGY